jgi:predicted AlkP superfamily phosphohydrolase/phosphomutase
MNRRLILFGVDGLCLPVAERLAAEGCLPHFRRMMQEGALTPLLPFVSTWGPINFQCLATGAAPGTAWLGTRHAPPWQDGPMEAAPAIGGETLWQALERQGRTSVLVAYPAAWPPGLQHGVVIAPDRAATDLPPVELARPALYLTPGLERAYRQPPGTRAGWIPLEARGRSGGGPQTLPEPRPKGDGLTVPFSWRGIGGHGALTCEVRLQPGASGAALSLPDSRRVTLPADAWSDWFSVVFPEGAVGQGRARLLERSADGCEVAFCTTEVWPERGWARPTSVEAGLLAAAGPYASGSALHLRPTDPYWATAVQEAQFEADWLAACARSLADQMDWSLWATVFRPADTANHDCLAYLDPTLPYYGGARSELAWEIMAGAYGAMDRALGGLLELADDGRTLVALVSDHGAAVNHVVCDVYNLLIAHRLLAVTQGDAGLEVDWERTQVYVRPTRSGSELFINRRGREPHGIVPPEACDALQRRLVNMLLDWREPTSGQRAVAVALTHRDAALLGYWGAEAGDVQFIYNEGCVWGELPEGVTIATSDIPAVNHGPQIPTAGRGLATNMGLLALWGPGVRRGYRRPAEAMGPARMSDPAATLAHWLGCPTPRHSEGALLRDMLEE